MPATLTPGRPPAADDEDFDGADPGSRSEQAQFDAAVNRDGRIVLQVLGGVAILAALVMSIIALLVSTGKNTTSVAMPMQAPAAAVPSAAHSPLIRLSVAGENKEGSDGKMHDSFSKTNFVVRVGKPTRLRITNTDTSKHSITAAATGVSITVLPGTHTYTMVATTAGRFEWVCVIPCDGPAHGWAMTHPGYMAGFITAT